MPSSQDMQDLEDEMDHYADRAAALSRLLKKADGRIAELEAQRDALLAACERLLKRLDARERYAAGYRIGRVPESVFDTLEQTRDAENNARIAIARARGETAG